MRALLTPNSPVRFLLFKPLDQPLDDSPLLNTVLKLISSRIDLNLMFSNFNVLRIAQTHKVPLELVKTAKLSRINNVRRLLSRAIENFLPILQYIRLILLQTVRYPTRRRQCLRLQFLLALTHTK